MKNLRFIILLLLPIITFSQPNSEKINILEKLYLEARIGGLTFGFHNGTCVDYSIDVGYQINENFSSSLEYRYLLYFDIGSEKNAKGVGVSLNYNFYDFEVKGSFGKVLDGEYWIYDNTEDEIISYIGNTGLYYDLGLGYRFKNGLILGMNSGFVSKYKFEYYHSDIANGITEPIIRDKDQSNSFVTFTIFAGYKFSGAKLF